jgi:hypothetical protein
MRLASLDFEDPPEQVLVGLYPQEGLADYTIYLETLFLSNLAFRRSYNSLKAWM